MADDAGTAPTHGRPAVPPDEVPGESRFATVNGVRLHYVAAGPAEGPPVVLLHGFPEFWYAWRRQIPALADAGFRVVAPDLRGYNRSERPPRVRDYRVAELVGDVAGLLRACGDGRASLVGHDWGGGIAWQTAIERPDLIDRLAVLNAPHPSAFERELRGSPRQIARSWYVGLFQVPWLPERLLPATLDRAFADADPGAVTETDLERYRRAFDRPGAPRAAVNYYRALVRDGARRALLGRGPRGTDVHAPTLVIWGERDRALDARLLDGLDAWVADLRVERLGASHWVHHDQPERVNESLIEFLA